MTGNKVREALHKYSYCNDVLDRIANSICNSIPGSIVDGVNADSATLYINITSNDKPMQSIDYYCTIDCAVREYIISNECKEMINDCDDDIQKDYHDLVESCNYSGMYNATIHSENGLICIYL